MARNDDSRSRWIAGLAFLVLAGGAGGGAFYLNSRDTAELEPAPVAASEPEEVVESMPEQELAPAPYEEPAPEILAAAVPESTLTEAFCGYPGDGFTPTPEGASLGPGMFVEFDYPRLLSGEGAETELELTAVAPLPTGSTACVVLMYDISDTGKPINIEVYDVQPADDALADAAVAALGSWRYTPGRRNNKSVRINQNVAELRFRITG